MSKQFKTRIRKNQDVTLSSQSQLSVEVPQFYREHYEISCWKDSEENIYTNTINIGENKTISAVWIGKKYNIKLNKDGGECSNLSSYRYEQGAILPTDWSKTGYDFIGWKNNSELTGENITEILDSEFGDKEYWVKNQHKKMSVTYHTNYNKIVGTDWTKVNEWLPTLEVGDTSISCPTCSGFMPITLQVVDKDTISCDGYDHTVTFQFNNVLTNKDGSAFTTEFNNYGGQQNRYCASSIKFQVMQEMFEALTSTTNIFIHNDDGSLKTGEDLVQANAFLNAIQAPTLSVVYYGKGSLQGQETFADKFWLPSYTQIGGVGSPYCEVEDKCLSYFKDESENPIGDNANDKRVRTIVGGSDGNINWLRTAPSFGIDYLYCNDLYGGLNENQYKAYNTQAVCPCLTLAYND